MVIGGTLLTGGRFSLLAQHRSARIVMQAITTSMYALGVPANALLAIKGFVVIVVILLLPARSRNWRARLRRPARERRPGVSGGRRRAAPQPPVRPARRRRSCCSALAYAYGACAYEAMRDPQVFLNLLRAAPFLLISASG